MAHKQLFAKIGVFVLLGLNVAAYYAFWPNPNGASKPEAKAPKEEKGEAQLLPTKAESTKPRELPPETLKDAVPLSIPMPPKLPDMEGKGDDAVNKLLDHIRKETDSAKVGIPPPLLVFPDEKKDVSPPKDPDIGVTSALTPKMASPWLLHTETSGNQTLLIARLHHPGTNRPAAEFRILCDRVAQNGPDGDLQAVGKVTFAGAGMRGACQRITLPLHAASLLFEEQAYVVQDANAGSTMRGERFVWELAVEAKRPGLGAPK